MVECVAECVGEGVGGLGLLLLEVLCEVCWAVGLHFVDAVSEVYLDDDVHLGYDPEVEEEDGEAVVDWEVWGASSLALDDDAWDVWLLGEGAGLYGELQVERGHVAVEHVLGDDVELL